MQPYSNVEYDYQKAEEEQYYYEEVEEVSDPVGSDVEVAMTGSGHRIVVNSDDTSKIREHNYLFEKSSQIPKGLDCKGAEDKDESEDDNDLGNELEEWDRHEALHDDVTKQDRTSPVFFEEEIELKWEKGGSGLVFYTDNNFWKDHENKGIY